MAQPVPDLHPPSNSSDSGMSVGLELAPRCGYWPCARSIVCSSVRGVRLQPFCDHEASGDRTERWGDSPHLRPEPHKTLFHAHGITHAHTHVPHLLLGQPEFVTVPDPTDPALTEMEQGGCAGSDGQMDRREGQCWGPMGGTGMLEWKWVSGGMRGKEVGPSGGFTRDHHGGSGTRSVWWGGQQR